MDNGVYLFCAYSVVWIIIFLYSHGISKRQRSLESQMAEMREALRKELHPSGNT